MTGKRWKDRLTEEQREQVERELHDFGLDRRQIESLMNYRGAVTDLELKLMREMPDAPRGRPTISSVKDALRTCKLLKLIE